MQMKNVVLFLMDSCTTGRVIIGTITSANRNALVGNVVLNHNSDVVSFLSSDCQVPDGYRGYEGKFYKLYSDSVDHAMAKQTCQDDGAWLAMPKTPEEYNIIKGNGVAISKLFHIKKVLVFFGRVLLIARIVLLVAIRTYSWNRLTDSWNSPSIVWKIHNIC